MGIFDLPTGANPAKDTPVGKDEMGRTIYQTGYGARYVMPDAPKSEARFPTNFAYEMTTPQERAAIAANPPAPQPEPNILSGTGIVGTLGNFNQMLNPVEAIGQSMSASQQMLAPETAGWDRVTALGNMLSGVAGVTAPAAAAYKAAMPAATALMESLLGWSPLRQPILDRATQPGPMPTLYSNPIAGDVGRPPVTFDEVERAMREAQNAPPIMAGGPMASDVSRPPVTFADAERAMQEAPLAEIPRITPSDLQGARIIPAVADLTRAGGYYTGIDASKIDVPEAMLGGPGYPLLKSSQEAGLAWAVQGKSVGTKKAGTGADLVAISAMNPTSHQSNISFINSLVKTTAAYVRDGRITPGAITELDARVRTSGAGGDPSLVGLARFPGFKSPNLNEWVQKASFPERSRIADIISSRGMQDQGMPNVNRILQETVDTKYAGANPRDVLLFIEPDFSLPPVDLLAEGLPVHPSYRYGIRGRVFGALPQYISTFEAFPTYWGEKNIDAFGPEFNQGGRRAFDMTIPIEEVTGKQVKDLERILQSGSNQFPAGSAMRLSPIDTRIVTNSMLNKWKPTNQPVNAGGASPQAFVDAITNSKYRPALTSYTAKDIKAGAKSGDLVAYQLGDDDVFFAIDSKPDYSWAGVDMMPDDKALVGVVSNAPGAKGTAAPSVMAKAIEDGVTVLDAFAVPSKRFPDGYLPEYYGEFGFEEAGRVPFDKEMYIADHGEQDYKDLLDAWKSDGWDESMGMPPVIVMRWSGNNADRAATAAGIRGAGAPSHRAETQGFVAEAEGSVGRISNETVQQEASSVRRGDRGEAGVDNRASLSSRARETAKGILGSTPEQLKNQGLTAEQILGLQTLRDTGQ